MYLILLTLTLLAMLSVARRLVEPACPSCSGKSWAEHPPHLTCTACGWSTAPSTALAVAPAQIQGS